MNISLTSIKKPFVTVFSRYHFILFMVIVVGGVAAFVFLLNSIVVKSSAANAEVNTSTSTTFDQKTIDRINQYKSSNTAPKNVDFSNGRSNPFQE